MGRPSGNAVLVDTEWLDRHLDEPDLRVVEVVVSPSAYDQGHIPGAVLWNVYTDLKDANYQLVDKAAIEALLSRSGIDKDTVVVFYGYAPAMGFWLMKLYGHADARLLDADRATWQAEGRPWTTAVATPAATHYPLRDEDDSIRALQPFVQQAIGDSRYAIADVRTHAEYRGERFWPSGGMEENGRAGHIPSATHVPIDGLYDARGAFRDADDLRRIYSTIDLGGDQDIISYCTIGGRAATAWFVLTYLLGYERARVYDGSWAEWGRMPGTPVE